MQELVERCATYRELERLPPHLEREPFRMYRRIGERLTKVEHGVYGVVRQARRLRRPDGEQFAGAWISLPEMASIVGCHPSAVGRAVRQLVELGVLRRGWYYVPTPDELRHIGYARAQQRNAYTLGPAALEPRPAEVSRRPPKTRAAHCEPHCKTASLLNPEYQKVTTDTTAPKAAPSSSHASSTARTPDAPVGGVGSADEDHRPSASQAPLRVAAEGSGTYRAHPVPVLDDDARSEGGALDIARELGIGTARYARFYGEVES